MGGCYCITVDTEKNYEEIINQKDGLEDSFFDIRISSVSCFDIEKNRKYDDSQEKTLHSMRSYACRNIEEAFLCDSPFAYNRAATLTFGNEKQAKGRYENYSQLVNSHFL